MRSSNARARRSAACRDAQVFALVPGAVRGLGDSSGFTMQLQNRGGMNREQFAAARDRLLAMANANPRLTSVRLSDLPDVATLKIDVDTQRLTAYGINNADVNATLATRMGQAGTSTTSSTRAASSASMSRATRPIARPPKRSANGMSVRPMARCRPSPPSRARAGQRRRAARRAFQGVPAFEISGQPAAGTSSGEAMDEMEAMAAQIPGTSVAWSGSSYQERLSSGQAPLLYAISLLVVFLCLAALYESWSIPLAVILVIPLGLIGAVFAVNLRGLENDVYLQIGLLTTMGLAAKNAILMIEFAEQEERKGKRVIEAAVEAARIRLRPILMTSFAFIFGVLPLAIATGARREQPRRDRHVGDRRHAHRRLPRDLLHPAFLRARPPRRA